MCSGTFALYFRPDLQAFDSLSPREFAIHKKRKVKSWGLAQGEMRAEHI